MSFFYFCTHFFIILTEKHTQNCKEILKNKRFFFFVLGDKLLHIHTQKKMFVIEEKENLLFLHIHVQRTNCPGKSLEILDHIKLPNFCIEKLYLIPKKEIHTKVFYIKH